MSALHQRGGTTVSLRQAQTLFRKWKGEEMGWLKARILWLAEQHGEYHGDQLEDVQLSERNIIEAVVNALVQSGLLISTGEHRRGRSAAAHARRSYVYRLTEKGESVAAAMKRVPVTQLPARPVGIKPPTLFDQTTRTTPEVEVDLIDVARSRSQPKPVVLNDDFWRSIERANELRSESARAARAREREGELSQRLSWDAE